MSGDDRARGFTLLEVMIALAILGLMLTSLLSIVAGQYDSNVRARNITVADAAARCKVSELEEQLLKMGYPLTDQFEDGPCCDGENPVGMHCHWAIEAVVLPNPPQTGDGGAGGLGGMGDGGSSGFGSLAALAGAAQNPGSLGDAGIGGFASLLSGGTGGSGMPGMPGMPGMSGMPGGGFPAGGVNAIAGMAMNMVYPQLKPLLEASIRRVTVDVIWSEGPTERKTTIVLFVTNPTMGMPAGMAGADGGLGVPGAVPGAAPGAAPGMPGTMPRFGGM